MRKTYPINEEKRLKRCGATGKEYEPFIRHTDFSSEGNVIRAKGQTVPRVYNLFSNLEYAHFLMLDRDPYVTDIREQYPLSPKEDTLEIARRLGIKHPKNPKTGEPVMMTTDLLVTRSKDGKSWLEAYDVKPYKRSQHKRVKDKRLIEEAYWKNQGVPLTLLTERDVDRTVINNLKILSHVTRPKNELLLKTFKSRLPETGLRMRDFFTAFDEEFSLTPGTGLNCFEWLVKDRQIDLDLKKHLHKKEIQNAHWKDLCQCV